MTNRTPALLTTCLALALLPVSLLATTRIHVAPQGHDGGAGTVEHPLATPRAARDKVRQVIARGLTEPVEIVFAPGTYALESALELRPEDSGTDRFPIIWKAAPGTRVVWSGAIAIPSTWSKGNDGVWSVDLKGVGPSAWNFRQLFVDEKRATRARFPNADTPNPFLYATGGDRDHAFIAPALVKEAWGRAADAQINIVPQWRFFNQWNTVTKVDPATGRIDIADSERHAKIIPGNWFWIEGVLEELDQPGESSILSLEKAKEDFQRRYVLEVLERNNGNRTQTARDLGVDPRTIFRYLEREANPMPSGQGGPPSSAALPPGSRE